MLFEVIGKNQRVFYCEEPECLPTRETLKSMLEAGYEIKINGKKASKKTTMDFVKENAK